MPVSRRPLSKAGRANRKKDLLRIQNNLRVLKGEKPIIKDKTSASAGKALSVEYDGKPFPVGFNSIQTLRNSQMYSGKADKVMLVWNEHQIVPAEQFRKAHFTNMKVDIVVCEDPNVQFRRLGEKKSLIYHFS